MKVNFLYFSWIREILGKREETIDIPSSIKTVMQLLDWQRNRGNDYAIVFEKRRSEVRIAIDLQHVKNVMLTQNNQCMIMQCKKNNKFY